MFKLIKIENGRQNVPEPEYLEVTANVAISIGQTLKITEGKLAAASGTDKPTFIAMGELSAAASKRILAVCRVESNQVYEAPITAAPTALKVGDKVTISTPDGLGVTATTASGVATIVSLNGATDAGQKVIVRF
jgi:hypothetical protein